jgi:hypothetical protein
MLDDRRRCVRCGADLEPSDVEARPGPGSASQLPRGGVGVAGELHDRFEEAR